jgi:hypothetical protein
MNGGYYRIVLQFSAVGFAELVKALTGEFEPAW